MQYRKAWLWLTVWLWAVSLLAIASAQLIEERVIARGQIRNLSVSFVYNNRVYVSTSSEKMLAIYDPSASPNPWRGSLNYPGNTPRSSSAIFVDGNYAYIHYESGSQGKLAIVNVSNPDSPTLAGELTFPAADPTYISMAKVGNFLYLFPYQGNFAVVDVSNPASPTLVRRVTATASAGVVVGNRLYTAEGSSGVRIYDISQPDNPTLLATISSVSNIGRVAAANGRLYALRSYSPPLQLHIFDLSTPDNPALVHSYSTERVAGLAAIGDFVFLSGFERGTEVLNVANPNAPTVVRTLPNHSVQNADPTSGRVLIQGQSILVLHNPATDQTVRNEQPYPIRAEQRGNIIYTVDEQSVIAFDVSNLSVPSLRGVAYLQTQRESNTDLALIGANHLAVSSAGVLYIFEHTGSNLNEVVRDSSGAASVPGFGDRVRVSGTNLAMYNGSARVQLFDVDNPASPVAGGFITASSGKFDLEGNYLYDVQSNPRSLRIYDITNLNAPNLVGSVNLPQANFISDMAVGGGYVLTSDYQGNLALVDARNPSNPQVVAQTSVANVSNPRVAYDGTAFVFYVYDGLNQKVYMFRASDFPNLVPTLLPLNREMYTLSFYSERVIGAGRAEGLIQYRNTLLGGPAIAVTSISPNRGANAGALSVTVIGAGFENGATVRLERGAQQINAVSVRFVGATRLDATFEFNGQPVNTQWDVVVRNPNGQEGRLPNGFSIVEATPSIASITPQTTLPLRSVTITINGSMFVPGLQATLLPPDGVSVDPINATSVEYISQNRIRATFNLSPYQPIQLPYMATARIRVRNPNNQESNLVDLRLETPQLVVRATHSLALSPDTTSVELEVEVENSRADELMQIYLVGVVGDAERRVEAAQVQSLGGARWRVVIPAQELIPDNFAQTWRLYAHHLGTFNLAYITFFRPYSARIPNTREVANTQGHAEIQVSITNDSPEVSVVLRQGDRTIEPSDVQRNPDGARVGVTWLTLRYPIRLEDIGAWNAEVRYPDSRSVTIANALQVNRGTVYIESFEWIQPFTVYGSLRARMRIQPSIPDVQVRVPLPARNAVSRTELVSTRITPAEDGSLTVEFEDVETAFRGVVWDGMRVTVTHPLLESATYWTDSVVGGTLEVISSLWIPNGYRAGRVNQIGTIYLYNHGPYPETPYLEFPIPVRESVLQSGQFKAEYEVVRGDGVVVDAGELPLTPDNYTIRAVLKPVMPHRDAYYTVRVRFVPTGRSAPPVLRGRVPVVAVVAVVGTTTLLSYLGHQLLDATCNSSVMVQAIRRRIVEELTNSPDPNDWLDVPDESEIRRLMRILYDDGSKQGFLQSVLQGVTTDYLMGLGESAATELLKTRLANYLARRIPEERAEWYADLASQLAPYVYKTAKGEISYTDLLNQLFGAVLPSIPTSIAQKAVETMLDKGKECLEKVDTISKIYTHRVETRQRADVGFSYDPNEKQGAGGVDGYIRADDQITYRILFENLATATAGAEEVLIEDVLPEGLDLSTLEFLGVQVGELQRALPDGTTQLNLDLDMRPAKPVIVQVRSELDANRRTLRVRFKGIDPNTGDYYEQGFLPPNQNPPQGEGSVTFRIRPLGNTPSGTQFVNRATIIFDPHLGVNAPIVTNAHTITLDKNPPSVVVQLPASSVPETKAQLSWQATDDASGVAEVEIWAQEGENARRIGQTRAAGERSETGTVLVRARRFGDETRILTRAVDRVGNIAPLSDQPVAVIRMGQAPQFSAGLHLLGVPLQPDAPDLQPIFGFQNNQWATYDPSTGQYVSYPNAASAIGRGFWTVLPNAVQPNLAGDLPDPEQPFRIELQPGWNLIANPWTEPLVWHREAVQVRVQGVARPLSAATEFVEPYLWGWEPNPSNPRQGRYQLVYDAQLLPGIQNTLQPWRGYWIYAKQACTLELPTPDEAALFAGLTRSYRPERNGGWSFRIGAQLGDSYEEVLLGVTSHAQGLQIAMPPAPPTRGAVSGVQLRLTRNGMSLAAEIQPRSRRIPTWTLEVSVPPTDDERTRTLLITAPDLAHLPRGINPVLRDMQTGERRFLRNGVGWFISVPREGLTRTYEVSLINTSRLLRITGLQVQTSRSTRQHTVQFTLSDEARISITVLAGGQTIRTLEQGRSRGRGVQQAVWDGRDAQGRMLPPGSYQILVQAETDDGQLVRAVAPIILTR